MVIWKYECYVSRGAAYIVVNKGAKLLLVDDQDQRIRFWFAVDPEKPETTLNFHLYFTADTLAPNHVFVKSFIARDGTVIHVFVEKEHASCIPRLGNDWTRTEEIAGP